MTTTGEITAIVAVVGTALSFLGITGIDSGMISSAVTGVISLVTLGSAIWTWYEHRKAAQAQQPK